MNGAVLKSLNAGMDYSLCDNITQNVPMHANKQLLTDVMRNEFNWKDGLIASDCADISKLYAVNKPWSQATGFHIAQDMNGAVLKSMNAGMDVSQ